MSINLNKSPFKMNDTDSSSLGRNTGFNANKTNSSFFSQKKKTRIDGIELNYKKFGLLKPD